MKHCVVTLVTLEGVVLPSYWLCCASVRFTHSVVSDSATPWTAARQASLSIYNSQSLLKLMSIKSVMPSNHLILHRPLLLLCLECRKLNFKGVFQQLNEGINPWRRLSLPALFCTWGLTFNKKTPVNLDLLIGYSWSEAPDKWKDLSTRILVFKKRDQGKISLG